MQHSDGFTNYVLSNLTLFQLDFLVAIIGFTAVRYYLPNYILEKPSTLRTGVVLAFCYALFGSIRGSIIDAKNSHDTLMKNKAKGVGYYYGR